MQEQQKRKREGGESVDFKFSFPAHVMSEFDRTCALWPKPAVQAFAPALSDSYLLDERARGKDQIKRGRGNHLLLFFLWVRAC